MSIAGWIVLGAFIALFTVWWALPSLQGPQGFTGEAGVPGRDGEDGKTVVLIERKPVPLPPLPVIKVTREVIEDSTSFYEQMMAENRRRLAAWDYGRRP